MIAQRHLAVAVTPLLLASPSVAAERMPTADEAQILSAFDAAVKAPDALAAMSALPWTASAKIVNPTILTKLKACKLVYAGMHRGAVVGGWNVAPGLACPTISNAGYYAQIKLKDGRIDTVLLGESEIVLTSERPN